MVAEQDEDIQGILDGTVNVEKNLAQMDIYEQQQETEFFEPNLEPYQRPRFISPKITPELKEAVRKYG